jgi:hypothetical protein
MGLEQGEKDRPDLRGIASLKQLNYLEIACEYGVSPDSFAPVRELSQLSHFFLDIGQYPFYDSIEHFPQLETFEFRWEFSDGLKLPDNQILPQTLKNLIVHCFSAIFPVEARYGAQLDGLEFYCSSMGNLEEYTTFKGLASSIENCPNLKKFRLIRVEDEYGPNYAPGVRRVVPFDETLSAILLKCSYKDGLFRPGGREQLIKEFQVMDEYYFLGDSYATNSRE